MLVFSCLKVNMFVFVRNEEIWMSTSHKRMWIFFFLQELMLDLHSVQNNAKNEKDQIIE